MPSGRSGSERSARLEASRSRRRREASGKDRGASSEKGSEGSPELGDSGGVMVFRCSPEKENRIGMILAWPGESFGLRSQC